MRVTALSITTGRRLGRDAALAALLVAAGWLAAGCVGPVLGPVGSLPGSPASQPAGEGPAYSDKAWAAVLRKFVAAGWVDPKDSLKKPPLPGLVDYTSLQLHPEDLNAYMATLAVTGPNSTPEQFRDRRSRVAYYINAYNALAVRAVLEQLPAKSVYRVDAPSFEYWWRFVVDGREVNLHQIKQAALEEAAGDVRVLFAMCGAAVGTPPLSGSPYRPQDLEAQLKTQAALCMRLEQIVKISHEARQLRVWYEIIRYEDRFSRYYEGLYGVKPPSLLSVLLEFAEPEQRATLNTAVGYRVVPMPFDRRLNRLVIKAGPAKAGLAVLDRW